ncbi:MAG TPA: acyl-ACP--UDP-N-acetylglucosamine O-acyltransferase [Terrimicrobiaceae bacterium]
MKIHPTAVISPDATLGSGTYVGPYAIIEENVVIGDDCVVQAHAILTDHVTIGNGNFVGYGTVIGSAPQDFAHNESIRSDVKIGNGNTFREYVTIHRGSTEGTTTIIGDNNFLMSGVHIGHNVRLGNRTVIANNCLLAGHVDVQDEAVLGGGSVFHQFLRIGRTTMVRGGTAWSKDIPPFALGTRVNGLGGLNVIGMRRGGLDLQARLDVKRAFSLFYRSGLNFTQAIEHSMQRIWTKEAETFFAFVKTKSRLGLCRLCAFGNMREDPLNDPDS